MARNSRFRTTSGPSSKRPRQDKGKPGKDSGEKRVSFRKEGGRPIEKKRSFGGGKGKPFQKGPWREKPSQPEGEKSGDFARRRVSKFSTPEKPSRTGASDREDSKPRYSRSEGTQSEKPTGKPGGFAQRGTRPFSKGDFKRKSSGSDPKPSEAGPEKPVRREFDKKSPSGVFRKGQSQNKREAPSFSKRSREEGDKKPSFIESKLQRQRKVASSSPIESGIDKPKDELIRLNKFISNSGVCSRREADNLITMGLITVNGKSITELGHKVKVTDDVRYEGRRLKSENPVYILLNKPKGFITTTDDPQERNTVMQLIQGACKERVYPVGRLDRNTSGLLLLTNDGDLTDKLTHPSYNVKKIYKAELDKPLTKADFQKILDGVHLEEGRAIVDDLAIVSDDGKTVGLEIHIGWNRVIRRIFEALDYDVVRLDRSVYATLDKKDLSRGHWRFLRQDEVIRLKHFQ